MNIDLSQVITAEDKAVAAIEAARAAAHDRLRVLLAEFSEKLAGNVPVAEQLSWRSKEEAAQAVLNESAGPDHLQMLAREAEQTGEAVPDLSKRIVRKAQGHRMATAFLAGLRRRYQAEFDRSESGSAITSALRELEAELAGYVSDS